MTDLADRIIDAHHLADLPTPAPRDGRTCPPCRGRGSLVVDRFDGTAEVVACPWCGGDGNTAAERAELAALEQLWGGGVGG